eukprot:6042026-Karenia_brevis.AAC.1
MFQEGSIKKHIQEAAGHLVVPSCPGRGIAGLAQQSAGSESGDGDASRGQQDSKFLAKNPKRAKWQSAP